MKKKISVLIPSYNDQDQIYQVLNSLINQKKIPDQIVVADDNSKDNTVKIIKKFIQVNTKVNVQLIENKKNLGLYDNLKENLDHLKNDVVFLGSANDPVYYDFFYDAIEAFNTNKNIKMFFGGFEVNYNNKNLYKKKIKNIKYRTIFKPKDYLKYVLNRNEVGVSFSPSTIYDITALKENYFDKKLLSYHDTFTNNLIGLKFETCYSPKIYSCWQFNPDSFSQKNQLKNFLIYYNVTKKILFNNNFFLYNITYIVRWITIYPLKIFFNFLFPYQHRLKKNF